ncbi:hypothetical protein K435DRAFT_869171 [Dendrothele bispora CBS 962.96]|uniref:Reverse transcriptase domain-containing protein n=1 Tax=Dendrothele bispora (strain CBS 962.96) TaxID=1314807 RepID=A0A4S8L9U8_DENBC|nr:hypothetical protein K435DRAFT_869171 [Dendrothele bispora CBS 962.96]
MSAFTQVISGRRQRSKIFLSPFVSTDDRLSMIQDLSSFTRRRNSFRQRSRRFRPTKFSRHQFDKSPQCAELVDSPESSLLSVEFAAPKSLSATVDEFISRHNLPLGEPLLLPVESHATTPSEPEFSLPFSDIFSPQNFPPPRPNTSPRANVTQDSPTTSHRVTSTLNRSAWEFFLSDYPDRQFVDTLLHIIDYGANIGFHGDRLQSQSSTNLSSAHEHPDVIDSMISSQLSKGRLSSPFPSPPFTPFRTSPLGVVTRKHSSKHRPINHLSWPRGTSVNDGIPDSEASIEYDMFACAARDLVASGPGSLMVKLDLEQAFRHIPIRSEDWPLLGYFWKNSFPSNDSLPHVWFTVRSIHL